LFGAAAMSLCQRGWLSAWKTITIHAARLNITTIGMTMAARFDPVMTIISSEQAVFGGRRYCSWVPGCATLPRSGSPR